MLAVRNVLTGSGNIGVYLFDEIDAGMGGQTAFVVGRKLRRVAEKSQVICITHLAQVAAFADHQFAVCKSTEKGRTFTRVSALKAPERKTEIARMLGGLSLTPKALQNAEALLKEVRS
jgi:DNA repair protein RecN (Recombination protein N)